MDDVGVLDGDGTLRAQSGDGEGHGQAVIPMRVDDPPARDRVPRQCEAIRRFLDLHPHRAQLLTKDTDPIRLLMPEFFRFPHSGRTTGIRGGNGQRGEFVNHADDEGAGDFGTVEKRVMNGEVASGFVIQILGIGYLDIGAHRGESVEQAGAGGVEANTLKRDLRAGGDERGDDEERGRGDVTGDGQVQGSQRGGRRGEGGGELGMMNWELGIGNYEL